MVVLGPGSGPVTCEDAGVSTGWFLPELHWKRDNSKSSLRVKEALHLKGSRKHGCLWEVLSVATATAPSQFQVIAKIDFSQNLTKSRESKPRLF